jgi:hypothetical protein
MRASPVLLGLLLAVACKREPPPAPIAALPPPPPALPEAAAPPAPPPAPAKPVLLFVKIPEAIQPTARGPKYEAPVDQVMRARKLGWVSGGGTMLARDRKIEYVGLDVEVTDVEAALPVLRAKLQELGAPKGSVIEEGRADGPTIQHKVW